MAPISAAGKLEGKVAVVTGGTSGIGLASARLFRDHGAHVYVTGRGRERLDAAVAGLGAGVTGVRADSADLDDLDRLFAEVEAGHGRVDVLLVGAGVARWESMAETTPETFDEVFAVNARGTFFTAQKALRLMPDGGSIILTGSAAHRFGLADSSTYCATKAAIRSYARTWVADLAHRRIRVNMLDPGWVDTAMTADQSEEFRREVTAGIPLGRYGRPEDMASAALFLASADSSYVNGLDLLVDGGVSQV